MKKTTFFSPRSPSGGGGRGRPGCRTPTVHVSHLPVGDVHLLVVTRRKGESDGVTPREHAVGVGLHDLGEGLKGEMNEGNQADRPGRQGGDAPC